MVSPRPGPGLQAVYASEPLPLAFSVSIFLGGGEGGWRQEVLQLLHDNVRGLDGVLLVGEPRPAADKPAVPPSVEQLLNWEEEAVRHCDLILMWLTAESLADFANAERWGRWQGSGKLILGTPLRDGPLLQSAERRRIPVTHTLADMVALARDLCRPGALRRGGERTVPLSLWRSPSFQSWFRALLQAGHRLDSIEVEWTHRARGILRPPFLWAVRPRVQVRGERRQVSGEVVIGRSDVSATVLYVPKDPSAPLHETLIVLVREYRAAVRNAGGFAWMLPGGSAARASEHAHNARATAAQEVFEETGLRLPPEQLEQVPLGDRQLLASLASHHGQLFRAALTESQLATLRRTAEVGEPFGASPSERCYVTVRRLGELLKDPDLDWSQLGMLLYALHDLG